MVEHRLGLSLAKLLERVAIFGVFVRQDRGGEMESSESNPLRADSTGTPNTGRRVLAAAMPGRWAAPPAAAIMTSNPRRSADSAY